MCLLSTSTPYLLLRLARCLTGCVSRAKRVCRWDMTNWSPCCAKVCLNDHGNEANVPSMRLSNICVASARNMGMGASWRRTGGVSRPLLAGSAPQWQSRAPAMIDWISFGLGVLVIPSILAVAFGAAWLRDWWCDGGKWLIPMVRMWGLIIQCANCERRILVWRSCTDSIGVPHSAWVLRCRRCNRTAFSSPA